MFKKLLILKACLLLIIGLQAGPVEDLIKSSGGTEEYPNADYLVIFDSTMVDVQESGLSYTNMHQLYKILTPKGALEKRVIKFGYDPLSAFTEIRKVKIHRKDGTIEEISVDEELDYPAPARMIYWGAREKMIEVGRLEPGDAVEVFLFRKGFTYALLMDGGDDDKYIPPMRGHFYDIVEFWSDQPVMEKVYQTAIPEDKLVQYEFYNGEVRSSARLEEGKMVYTFTKSDISPIKKEPNMVAQSDVAPKLLISTSPDWQAKSLWFYGVNEDYGSFESTPEIDAKVDEILQHAENRMDSITLLTHWVGDEIRYSGISMGEGEGFTLHTGEMNFRDRCGVCKDKAGMLITMLRAAGFESYPAMTMAGSRIDYIPADQFNHCVTLVKMDSNDYKLLDPTWVPFVRELWSSAEQQQNYLPGIPGGSDLKITPISEPENHYLKINSEAEVLEDGSLMAKLQISAEGQTDASIRRYFTSNYRSEWRKDIEQELLNLSAKARIEKLEFGEPYDYLSGPIHLEIEISIPDYALMGENEMIFEPVAISSRIFKSAMSHLYISTSPEEREYAFRDRCSRQVEIRETITFPEKYSPLLEEYEESFGDEASSFKGEIDVSDNQLHIIEEISLGKRIYQPADWPVFRKVLNAQKDFADKKIILVSK